MKPNNTPQEHPKHRQAIHTANKVGKIKLEHCTQEVATLPHFLLRFGYYLLFSSLLIGFSVGIGVVGYHHFGQLNWLDSFHMASMILTGMGPVAEMKTTAAKLFSSFYALYSGIAFLSTATIFIAPIAHRLLHLLHAETANDKDAN